MNGGVPDMSEIMPAIFFGHGNPMNAVMENSYTEAWRRIGRKSAKAEGDPFHIRSLVRARNWSND
jgi:hypothetical protein